MPTKKAATMQLALGTAQFGLAYGIAGSGIAVPEDEVRAILEDAVSRGVRLIDTATAYGDIESRLARLAQDLPLQVVSKIPAIPDNLEPEAAASFALKSARLSRDRLGPLLGALMLHQARDLTGSRGDAIWQVLAEWSIDEQVAIGASCYEPWEARQLAAERPIALAQLPGNAFDQRIGIGEDSLPIPGVEIHLRSAFLQGLLVMPFEQAVRKLPKARAALTRWHAWCAKRHLMPVEAALSVVKSFAAASAVVVGVDSLAQWLEIAAMWQQAVPINAPELSCDEAEVIDPRLWEKPA